MNEREFEDRLAGVLLGTAVGDALGLPYENLSPRRRRRLFPGPTRHASSGPWNDQRRYGTHAIRRPVVVKFPDDVAAFQCDLARRFRNWFLALPAGLGKATLRSCLKLCLGWPRRLTAQKQGNDIGRPGLLLLAGCAPPERVLSGSGLVAWIAPFGSAVLMPDRVTSNLLQLLVCLGRVSPTSPAQEPVRETAATASRPDRPWSTLARSRTVMACLMLWNSE